MKSGKIAIIGGGPAGLTAGIHLAQKGEKVILFEKEKYPRHKVCGEYLSREVLPYFENLGVAIFDVQPKNIGRLQYSTLRGNSLEMELPLGGLGISRFALDNLLYETALRYGVHFVYEKVTQVDFKKGKFEIYFGSEEMHAADYVLSAHGKRSVLDKSLDRAFFKKPAPWVAVKSHYRTSGFPDDLVALHNFKGGYCGLSKTENSDINFCYLATYESFREHKDPKRFNKIVLRKNPFLDAFLSRSTEVFEQPLTIAQISFSRKTAVHNHQLMLGDAAGLIHPLCGNGMAMAVHSAKIAAEVLLKHLANKTDRTDMELEYSLQWRQQFSSRLRSGKWLQKILLDDSLAEFSQKLISKMPFLLPQIVKQTHGKPIS